MQIKSLKAQLVIVVGFLILYIFFEIPLLLYFSASAGIVFLILPRVGNYFVVLWFKFAEFLGRINSWVILSAIFFLVISPLSIVRRIFSKNGLSLKNDSSSLFFKRDHTFSKKDLENTW